LSTHTVGISLSTWFNHYPKWYHQDSNLKQLGKETQVATTCDD